MSLDVISNIHEKLPDIKTTAKPVIKNSNISTKPKFDNLWILFISLIGFILFLILGNPNANKNIKSTSQQVSETLTDANADTGNAINSQDEKTIGELVSEMQDAKEKAVLEEIDYYSDIKKILNVQAEAYMDGIIACNVTIHDESGRISIPIPYNATLNYSLHNASGRNMNVKSSAKYSNTGDAIYLDINVGKHVFSVAYIKIILIYSSSETIVTKLIEVY